MMKTQEFMADKKFVKGETLRYLKEDEKEEMLKVLRSIELFGGLSRKIMFGEFDGLVPEEDIKACGLDPDRVVLADMCNAVNGEYREFFTRIFEGLSNVFALDEIYDNIEAKPEAVAALISSRDYYDFLVNRAPMLKSSILGMHLIVNGITLFFTREDIKYFLDVFKELDKIINIELYADFKAMTLNRNLKSDVDEEVKFLYPLVNANKDLLANFSCSGHLAQRYDSALGKVVYTLSQPSMMIDYSAAVYSEMSSEDVNAMIECANEVTVEERGILDSVGCTEFAIRMYPSFIYKGGMRVSIGFDDEKEYIEFGSEALVNVPKAKCIMLEMITRFSLKLVELADKIKNSSNK